MTTPEQNNTTQSTQNGGMNLQSGRDIDVEVGRDMIAGNQYTITIHQAPPQTLSPEQRQTQTIRTNLIHNVHNTWIKGFLHASLHTAVMLELDKSYQQDAVNRMWGLYDEQKEAPVPPDKPLTTLFDEAQRKLLILGEPGSGKTITLLQLGEELLQEAAQTPAAPVPVVLNLSRWGATGGALLPWLQDELNLQTGLAKSITASWLKVGQLILLLDGLDEVAADRRDDCVNAINTFMQEFQAEIAVCSRIKDYDALNSKLNLQNAIKIDPLSRAKIDAYLATHDPDLSAVRQLIPRDPVLLELAQTPLMLSVMTLAYRGLTPAELEQNLSEDARRQQLYTAYIKEMFHRRPLPDETAYDQDQACQWLTNIAHGMTTHNEQIFYVERLQPSWLYNRQKQFYNWSLRLITGFLITLLGGIVTSLCLGIVIGLELGVAFGLDVAVLSWLNFKSKGQNINSESSLIWSTPDKNELLLNLSTRAMLGSSFGLFFGFSGVLNVSTTTWVIVGFIGGTGLGLIDGLNKYIKPSTGSATNEPNQGILMASRNALLLSSVQIVTHGTAFALFVGVLIVTDDNLIDQATHGNVTNFGKPIFVLLCGVIFGLVSSLFGWLFQHGGLTKFQHYLVRWLLSYRNTLPSITRSLRNPDHDLITFLDAMRDRILLRRVGGGWLFIHRTLLEHFAAQHPEAEEGMREKG